MHAQFTNSKEVYIIALSGTGYVPHDKSPDEIKPTKYNKAWQALSEYLTNREKCPAIADIADKIEVAEFDAVYKACLAEHEGKIITDQDFLNKWVDRVENWIGEWYKHYQNMLKENKKFTIKWLVEKGMQDTYLEQMKVEAASEDEAMQKYKDITEFITDCIPDYLPRGERPATYKHPIRIRTLELLFSEVDLKEWFEEELNSHELSQHRSTLERLCREFTNDYFPVLFCWDVIHTLKANDIKISIRGINVRVENILVLRKEIENSRKYRLQYWLRIVDLIHESCREFTNDYFPLQICCDVIFSLKTKDAKISIRGINVQVQNIQVLTKEICYSRVYRK